MRKPGNYTDRPMCLILALAGLLSVAALAPEPAGRVSAQAVAPRWSRTGSLNTARTLHTATLLADGKVLVAGGYDGSSLKSAELYDPAIGTWSRTGDLNTGRSGHTATLLPNGKVLIAGGFNHFGPPIHVINSAELYDPATGTWSRTGNLNTGRRAHTATLLPNGKVLVTGGENGPNALDNAELYDPATGTWSLTGKLKTSHVAHTATLLPNGKVLVAGYDLDSAELYDLVTGDWNSTGQLNKAHSFDTAILVPNGKVLLTGWGREELYDVTTGMWNVTGRMNIFRIDSAATLLPNGQVLVAGGYNYNEIDDFFTAELYDPATGNWSRTANLNSSRYGHTATLLANGKVLVVGGWEVNGLSQTLASVAELFDPGLPQAGTVTSVSAASFSLTGLASEAIAASFGAGFATTTVSATTLPLPTQLAGATVKVKDSAGIERLAPLFFVSPTQVNYQIPAGTAPGAATVTITSGDGTASTGVALAGAVAPSLFAANGNGQGVAAALALRIKADGTQQLEPVAQFDAAQNKLVARPLDLGPETDQVFLILFGTGIRHRSSLSAVLATIGGAYAEVGFAGAQPDFVGVDQINVLLPRSLAGREEVDVLLTVEARMANAVRVNIK